MSLHLYGILHEERRRNRRARRVKGLADYILLYALAVLSLYLAVTRQWLPAILAATSAATLAILLGRPVRPNPGEPT
ncbi:MAG: hypothetical protein AABX89_07405 [Candidatus Thermoplasmatota archaeon]|mgnify:CR=1 FL=1